MARIDVQQTINTMAVGVMSVSIMSAAMGILSAGAAFDKPLIEQRPTDAAMNDLESVYGKDIVAKVRILYPEGSIVEIAEAVDREYTAQLYSMFGQENVDLALRECPPGDVRCVLEVSKALHAKGAQVANPVVEQKAVEQGKATARKNSKPVKDLKTGIIYQSKNQAGRAVGPEYGLIWEDMDKDKRNFIWYNVLRKDPKRWWDVNENKPVESVPAKGTSTAKPTTTLAGSTPYPQQAPVQARSEVVTKSAFTSLPPKQVIENYMPEWNEVFMRSGGQKPRKFIERAQIKVSPAEFNPTAIGDFDVLKSFDWNGVNLTEGPMYTYDSMVNVTSTETRTVTVPRGHRIWITVYSGQWGGYWHTVDIYVNPEDIRDPNAIQALSKSVPGMYKLTEVGDQYAVSADLRASFKELYPETDTGTWSYINRVVTALRGTPTTSKKLASQLSPGDPLVVQWALDDAEGMGLVERV